MNNKHLSWYKKINNNFIIASRAYFLHMQLWSVFPLKLLQSQGEILSWGFSRSCFFLVLDILRMIPFIINNNNKYYFCLLKFRMLKSHVFTITIWLFGYLNCNTCYPLPSSIPAPPASSSLSSCRPPSQWCKTRRRAVRARRVRGACTPARPPVLKWLYNYLHTLPSWFIFHLQLDYGLQPKTNYN